MSPIAQLATLLDCPALDPFTDPDIAFAQRDKIKAVIRDHLLAQSVQHWLDRLEPADIWCAEVLDWPTLIETEGFAALDMVQDISLPDDSVLRTTRCPIRIDGERAVVSSGGPVLGADTDNYLK